MCHIFNLTFTTGKIPNDLKVALVTPVYKASEQNVFQNRPISELLCFSKILEKLMYKRLVDYINKHDILTSCQYGFRSILFAHDANLFCSGKDLQELESIVNAQLTGVQE